MKTVACKGSFDPKKLKRLRTSFVGEDGSRGLTWLELSRALKRFEPNVSKNSVWGWERGLHEPSLKSLNALSALFKLPIDEFMKR